VLRLLAAAATFCLLTACSATPPPSPAAPVVDLGGLKQRVALRMGQLSTASYRTEVTWFGESGANVDTEVTGQWQSDFTGISATMRVRRGVGGTFRDVISVVLVPGKLFTSTASGDGWTVLTDQDDAERYYSTLAGFGLTTAVGAELDYLEPKAATVTAVVREDVDGVEATRYDLAVDPARMAPLFRDPYRVRRHDELAADKGTVTASVWLDDTDLPVKATSRLPFKEPRASTTWFTDWGQPVEITAP
jgi:hypothetical protein